MKDRIKHKPSSIIGLSLLVLAGFYFVYAEKATISEVVTSIMTLAGAYGLFYKPKSKSNYES